MKVLRSLLLVFSALIIYGMSEPAQVPPELRDLRAEVKDSKGVVHKLTAFRCNDGATLKFKRGSLDYTLSLTSIRSIEVLGAEDGSVKVLVRLKDGRKESFELPSSTRCTAQTDVGSVSFYITEVKSIELEQGEVK